MEIEYPAIFNVRGVLCFIPAGGDRVIYPTRHLPGAKSDPRKVDAGAVSSVIRGIGKEYPEGDWVVKFPQCNVDLDGQAIPAGHNTHNVADYGAGKLICDFLRKDTVSTDEDGVTVYEGIDRWGVSQVFIKFGVDPAVSMCTDIVGEILAPWL